MRFERETSAGLSVGARARPSVATVVPLALSQNALVQAQLLEALDDTCWLERGCHIGQPESGGIGGALPIARRGAWGRNGASSGHAKIGTRAAPSLPFPPLPLLPNVYTNSQPEQENVQHSRPSGMLLEVEGWGDGAAGAAAGRRWRGPGSAALDGPTAGGGAPFSSPSIQARPHPPPTGLSPHVLRAEEEGGSWNGACCCCCWCPADSPSGGSCTAGGAGLAVLAAGEAAAPSAQ